jgi:ribosomal-protein-alanine N-acetyltransferase
MKLFETKRLLVRRLTVNDAEAFYLLNSIEEIVRFIRPVMNREESDAFLAENIKLYKRNSLPGRFYVEEKESGCCVGTFSFLYFGGDADYHIGYALMPEAWGKGYASELVKVGTSYFFERAGHPAIFAITQPENIRSEKVLYRAGYNLKGNCFNNNKVLNLFCLTQEAGFSKMPE